MRGAVPKNVKVLSWRGTSIRQPSFMMQSGQKFLKTLRHDNDFDDTNQQVH